LDLNRTPGIRFSARNGKEQNNQRNTHNKKLSHKLCALFRLGLFIGGGGHTVLQIEAGVKLLWCMIELSYGHV